MPDLIFVTGNADKFKIAEQICSQHGIALRQEIFDVDEIQSEDITYIAQKKAEAAFAVLQTPVIVRDDAWQFPGLNGFPGAYMKSINHWFTENDFLRLTKDLADRRAILTQTIVYIDSKTQKTFTHETSAYLLQEAHGKSSSPSENILTIEGDNGLSISEVMATNANHAERAPARAWHEFIEWYEEYKK